MRIEEPDLTWVPMVFGFAEIDETPDRCGFTLVRRVYHAFGLREKDVPRHYDRARNKLILED